MTPTDAPNPLSNSTHRSTNAMNSSTDASNRGTDLRNPPSDLANSNANSPQSGPRWGIRRFILLWVGAIVLAFSLLCGGLVYSVARMHAQTSQVYFDSQSLQTNRAFETAIVAEGREDLLWRTTGKGRYQQARLVSEREAEGLLKQLRGQADSPPEVVLADVVARDYAGFRGALGAPAAATSGAAQDALDRLLGSLHRHRAFNEAQMKETLARSDQMGRAVNALAVTLILGALVLVGAGCIELWKRIFRPTLQLARAAQSFGVDLKTRVPEGRDDEMGRLARTFNAMAETIGDRERERLRFVATVAHDLRNPLVVIGGAAQLLQKAELQLTPAEREKWLGNIVKNARKMETIIADLMDGVQAETGQLSFQMAPFDLGEMAREITLDYDATTPSHPISYVGDEPCRIQGDRKRLERVLMNLISNAVKYSGAGNPVEVSLSCDGTAVLRVTDCGAGISPDDLPRLFAPFSRLERTKTMASGTGLGLSSVKKIIEGHGGTISIQSALGKGTTVEVRLPVLGVASNRAAR